MCGILVTTDEKTSEDAFKKGLKRLFDRGPDQSETIRVSRSLMGFARLAIMDLSEKGMQPFERDGYAVVCNGELYGFRKLKKELEKKYTFYSDSDCELLIPLFEEYGLGMFNKLDAEYALAMYTPEYGWIASRDPIGIRPLFYGYTESGKICFGSTAASLMPIADKILPFPPGYYYCRGQFIPYTDISKPDHILKVSEEEAEKHIHDLLIDGVLKRTDADAPTGYLLSGGLDSSLVCAIAQKHLSKPIRTFAVGMETDAIDLKYAKEVAEYIGSDHTEFIITRDDVIQALPEVIRILGTWDITTIRASIGMYLLCKKIHETTNIKVLMTGEVSDELFGYKYTDFAPDAQSFQKEAEKRVHELYEYDVLRADRCISANSLEGRVPFGDLAFVRYVMSIDPAIKMNRHHMGKYLLRAAFEKDQILPENILMRDKAAFSDAVGHSLVNDLKAYAEEYYSDEAYEEKRKKYSWKTPFTKESLLYREIFEQFYPGMDQMISDYWMPNQSWKGCQVNDPSARYLSNYGASAI
ncbi:MAG: asparagine synthase B [Erysipelotrichaceae bacterium]|nr:asparagine synthase B [Erysipelotrichaceae bacterium]